MSLIRKAFPETAAKTDALMRARGFLSDKDAEYLWVEAVADITNMHARRNDKKEVERLLRFFSEQFDRGTEPIRNCIDVSYVEHLMWDLSQEEKKWMWPKIPKNLQALYVAMWGEPGI